MSNYVICRLYASPLQQASENSFIQPMLGLGAKGRAEDKAAGSIKLRRRSRGLPRTVKLGADSGRSAGYKAITKMGGVDVNRPRAADDFGAIRARMEELRREREGADAVESKVERDQAIRRAQSV